MSSLKRSGLEIKDIKQLWTGVWRSKSLILNEKNCLRSKRKQWNAEIEHLSRVLDMIKFKCWYYEQAMQDGNEDRVHSMIPDKLPEDIQKMYDHAHKE